MCIQIIFVWFPITFLVWNKSNRIWNVSWTLNYETRSQRFWVFFACHHTSYRTSKLLYMSTYNQRLKYVIICGPFLSFPFLCFPFNRRIYSWCGLGVWFWLSFYIYIYIYNIHYTYVSFVSFHSFFTLNLTKGLLACKCLSLKFSFSLLDLFGIFTVFICRISLGDCHAHVQCS